MNILFISKRLGCSNCLHLGPRGIVLLALLALLVVPLATLYGGYQMGRGDAETAARMTGGWQHEVERQRRAVEEARQVAEENLNALALRVGQLQAHVLRLDALGQRLTRQAGLDKGEFNFESLPAQGGPESGTALEPMGVPDFVALLDDLEAQLEDRGRQLSILESMIMHHDLQAEVLPAGRPIEKGWLSSRFGMRTDPFTGKLEHHNGIDFAGKEGANVIAVASGVVTWAGRRYGYGNLVEVNHGKGYVTRYGHNKELKVEVGDTVKKGDVLALMGSTGRSTGPHVHFEVLHNGRSVDPDKYVRASR